MTMPKEAYLEHQIKKGGGNNKVANVITFCGSIFDKAFPSKCSHHLGSAQGKVFQ
jgi:hypothetical protein